MSVPIATSTLANLLAQSVSPAAAPVVGASIPAVDGTVRSNSIVNQLLFSGAGQFVNLRTDYSGYDGSSDWYVTYGPIQFRYFCRSFVSTSASTNVWFGIVPFFSNILIAGNQPPSKRALVTNMLGSVGARQGVPGAWCPDEAGMVGVVPVLKTAPPGLVYVGFYYYFDGWIPATTTVQLALAEIIQP